MRRSSHIAVRVSPGRFEEAISHYRAVLGVTENSRTDSMVGLSGPNFTLWIDRSDGESMVLQEFGTQDRDAAKAVHSARGCEIFDESEHGFHVRDPFGMAYHVWIESPENPLE